MQVSKSATKTLKIIGLALVICAVLYNEWFVYISYTNSWPPPDCSGFRRPVKILIVANPLILDSRENMWTTTWDYDNYLRSTFLRAVNHVRPQVVIFLGSLMRRGHYNNNNDFLKNFERFKDIYELERRHSNMSVFIPGEYDLRLYEKDIELKLERFRMFFGMKDFYQFGKIDLIPYNQYSKVHPFLRGDSNKHVVLSSFPILGLKNVLGTELVGFAYPYIILSAKDHMSVLVLGHAETGVSRALAMIKPPWKESGMKAKYQIPRKDGRVNEIIVPSCSYNTEHDENGFGMLILDEIDDSFCYGVLWLPKKIFSLNTYLVLVPLLIFTVVTAVLGTFRRSPRIFNNYKGYDIHLP